MRRVLVVAAGAAAGALVLTALSRAGVLDGARREWQEFTRAVREGMAQRESELRSALGMDAGTGDGTAATGGVALSAAEAQRLVEDPTSERAR